MIEPSSHLSRKILERIQNQKYPKVVKALVPKRHVFRLALIAMIVLSIIVSAVLFENETIDVVPVFASFLLLVGSGGFLFFYLGIKKKHRNVTTSGKRRSSMHK